jgi:dUTP pyrophosphatase
MPKYAKGGDAGADLTTTKDFTIAPGARMLIPTGISIALPNGYAAFVHPRSGLAIKNGISMVNTPGTVDAGYRGELQVILINHDLTDSVSFKKGDRIAQLVIQRVETAEFIEVAELPGSERAAGGFGSTGS